MPVIDLHSKLGIDLDKWLLQMSTSQPYKQAARCHAFEKEWIECSHGIGLTRAKQECKLEYEDLLECISMKKMQKRLWDIRQQRDKLIKEGKYTPPPCHSGQGDA